MEDKLISFETAKLAKEKGFNEPCVYIPNEDGTYCVVGSIDAESDYYVTNEYYTVAPTQSLLQKWLREKHLIHINIHTNSGNEGDEETFWYFSYCLRYDNSLHDDAFACLNDKKFNSYEEALEEALLITLDLINDDRSKKKV